MRYLLILCFLIICGCATAPVEPLPKTTQQEPGIYHRIIKGQTLWRISKIYNVDIAELMRVNRIGDTSNIAVGQLIFIPKQPAAASQGKETMQDDFIWPLKGKVIAVYAEIINNTINKGINIEAANGTNVVASRAGKAVFYDPDFINLGKTIIIDHGDGYSTLYARNSEVFIKPGDEITKGMLIAKAGSFGRDKNTYLHFEIRKNASPQNPKFYLSGN